MSEEWRNRIFAQSCESMQQLPDESIHCVVTSPPYLGLRAYHGGEQMIGLEGSIAAYLKKLVAVFREVRRVLRKDGTCFVNMGESWNAGTSAKPQPGTGDVKAWTDRAWTGGRERINANSDGLKVKDQMFLPHRLAMALQADGWWARDTIILSKTNPMPSSVADRCTPAFEYVFQLTKSARYFTDMDAVREPLAPSSYGAALDFERGGSGPRFEQRWQQRKANGAPLRHGTNGVTESAIAPRYKTRKGPNPSGLRQAPEPGEDGAFHPLGANARNVFVMATEPFTLCRYGCERCEWYTVSDAKVADRDDAPGKPDVTCPQCGAWTERESHYAVMPSELAKKCIKIGTSAGGCCAQCGAPRKRLVDARYENPGNRTTNGARSVENRGFSPGFKQRMESRVTTRGFEPTCHCNVETAPCVVLDPFAGVGTTLCAAFELGRDAVGYELSERYIQIAEARPQIRERREYAAAMRGEPVPAMSALVNDADLFEFADIPVPGGV